MLTLKEQDTVQQLCDWSMLCQHEHKTHVIILTDFKFVLTMQQCDSVHIWLLSEPHWLSQESAIRFVHALMVWHMLTNFVSQFILS